MTNRFRALALFACSSVAANAAPPLKIPSKSTFPAPPASQRFAKGVQSIAKGNKHGGNKGPAHPVSQGHKDNSTLPHWTGSFNSGGNKYSFTMVGTDPSKGSATTVIDAAIIPFKLIFSDGTVFDASGDMIDGQTALQGAMKSPVFQNVPFTAGAVNLGTTQFGDAMQRANFWNTVSTHSPGYHVLLSTPRVLPLQTVNVPASDGITFPDTSRCTNPSDLSTCKLIGVVDLVWLDNLLVNTMMQQNIGPGTLPVHLFSEIIAVGLNGYGALGYHNAVDFTGNKFKIQGAVTYIFSDWFANAAFGNEAGIGNTGTLSHEVAEWINDPFGDNIVPYWQDPLTPGFCEQDFLEVGDVVESLNYFTSTSQGFPFTLTDVAFLPWFERASPSTSVNGQYSFLNQLNGFSSACPTFVDYNSSAVDFPGAVNGTVLTTINNHNQMGGYWLDGSNVERGFLFDGKHFTDVNVNGAVLVQVNKINDNGEVVGTYLDGSFKQHGFVWVNGKSVTIDVPGADGTSLNGLNNGVVPDIVGSYNIGSAVYGFKLSGGQFQTLLIPGTSVSANGINNAGQIVGSFDNNGFFGTIGNFSLLDAVTDFGPTALTQPASLNKLPQAVGTFFDGALVIHGFVEFQGLWGSVDGGLDFDGAFETDLFDNNDGGTLVGAFVDLTGIHGFVATPVK